jgi:hypothetical protein
MVCLFLIHASYLGSTGAKACFAVNLSRYRLGCQITRLIFAEVGYRYLYDDFRDVSANDFLYQVAIVLPNLGGNLLPRTFLLATISGVLAQTPFQLTIRETCLTSYNERLESRP